MIFGNRAFSGKGLIDLGVPVAVLSAAGLFFLGRATASYRRAALIRAAHRWALPGRPAPRVVAKRVGVANRLHVPPISGGTIWPFARWWKLRRDFMKETTHVHNYHRKRDTGLVRVGVLYGPRLGAWHLDHGMVARDGVARAASSKTLALKPHRRISRCREPAGRSAGRRLDTRRTGHRHDL